MPVKITDGFLELHDLTTAGPRWVKGNAITCLIPLPSKDGYHGSQVTIGSDSWAITVQEDCTEIMEGVTASYKQVLRK